MSVESELILQRLESLSQDFKETRREMREDVKELAEQFNDKFEKQNTRIGALEQFRYSLHVLTAAAATAASWFGFKMNNGGGGM